MQLKTLDFKRPLWDTEAASSPPLASEDLNSSIFAHTTREATLGDTMNKTGTQETAKCSLAVLANSGLQPTPSRATTPASPNVAAEGPYY